MVATGLASIMVVPSARAFVQPGDGGGGGGCVNVSSGTLTASSTNPLNTQNVTVTWDAAISNDCTSVRLIYPDGSSQVVAPSGSITVRPPVGSSLWVLKVFSPGGVLQLATVTVNVVPLPSLPATALARNGDGRLDLLSVADARPGVTQQIVPNGTYAERFTPGGGRSVAMERNADNKVEAFTTTSEGAIFHSVQTAPGSSTWAPWSQMDGGLITVAVARNADGRLELFGANVDGVIWHRAQLAPGTSGSGSAGWTGWAVLDGGLRQVAAEENADGRIELFGVNGAGGVYHRWQTAPNSATWSGWVAEPANLASIAVARNADGRLEVVATDRSGAILDAHQTSPGSATLTGFTVLAGGRGGDLAAETGEDGRIELVGTGPDGHLAHRAQTAPNSTTWTSWVPLDRRTAVHPYVVACAQDPTCHYADLDGDQHLDLIRIAATGNVSVSLENPDSPGDFLTPQVWASGLCPTGTACDFGDVNGDGRADAVAFRITGANLGTARVAASIGITYLAPTTWGTGLCSDLDTCLVRDMDADGMADVVTFDRSSITAINDGRSRVALSTGNGFTATQTWSTNICLADQTCYAADLNGDNQPDAVALVTAGANKGRAWVALNTGTAFAGTQLWTSTSKCVDDAVCLVADFDDDGRADILAKSPTDTADTLIWVSRSIGTAFDTPTKQDPLAGEPRMDQSPTCAQLRGRYRNHYQQFIYFSDLYGRTHNPIYLIVVDYYARLLQETYFDYLKKGCPGPIYIE
jgi:hypothetical protein